MQGRLMDETVPEDIVTVGQRLREAREAKGLSVEDIAAQTRIPTRHLTSLEESDWDKLPAATYSIGFAKNYAGALGLDRTEIGDQLRAEMGGTRLPVAGPEIYEAVDPARTMPKGLVLGALGLLLVVVLALSWLSNRSMQADQPVAESNEVATPAASTAAVVPAPAPAAAGAVVITATEPVWLRIADGSNVLKEGQLAAGERFEVPATAAAPVLTTGKPEALQVSVGTAKAPPVGPAGRKVSDVSLKAADLMRTPASSAAATPSSPPVQAQPAPRPASRRSTPQVPPPATGSAAPTQPAEVNAADAATIQ
jgi:cytoskeleton protein RodZ